MLASRTDSRSRPRTAPTAASRSATRWRWRSTAPPPISSDRTAPAITGPRPHDRAARLAGPPVRRALPRALFADPRLPLASRPVAEPEPGRPVRRRPFRRTRKLLAAFARPGVRDLAGQHLRSDADDRARADG